MAAEEPGESATAALRRTRLALFALLLLVCGWFHQGGGWNQNVRFAQVRAIVESGRLSIDDYLLYTLEVGEDGIARYQRVTISNPGARSMRLPRAVSFDLSQYRGHLYPNKPPGVTLLALPGYALALTATRAVGADPDDAWTQTLCLYITTLLSVGLLAALGGLVFHDVARRLFPEAPPAAHLAASLAYALGTPVLAYATFLIDISVVATLSLLALRFLLVARATSVRQDRLLLLAGGCAGLAVVVNNSAALTVLALGVYTLAVLPGLRPALVYAAGGVGPALLLGAYQWVCFGSPFELPQQHQLTMFQTGAPLLGVFGAASWEVLPKLLFLPYRGLFFWSPVLLPAAFALMALFRRRWLRPEVLLIGGVFLAYLWMNASFNAWHAGGTFGPRYLLPAVPFLALPLVIAFQRAPVVTVLFATVSVALSLLVTSVSPQVNAAVHRPLTEFYLPLARGETVKSGSFSLRGPVSVRPVGFAVSGLETVSGESEIARWSSFNLGELLFPERWASLLPLALLAVLIWALGLRPRRAAGKS